MGCLHSISLTYEHKAKDNFPEDKAKANVNVNEIFIQRQKSMVKSEALECE